MRRIANGFPEATKAYTFPLVKLQAFFLDLILLITGRSVCKYVNEFVGWTELAW